MPNDAPRVPPDKASYLLHIWREKNEVTPVWRASVTVVVEGRRQGFPHPEAALHFLAARLGELQFSPFHAARSGNVNASDGAGLSPTPASSTATLPTPAHPEEEAAPRLLD